MCKCGQGTPGHKNSTAKNGCAYYKTKDSSSSSSSSSSSAVAAPKQYPQRERKKTDRLIPSFVSDYPWTSRGSASYSSSNTMAEPILSTSKYQNLAEEAILALRERKGSSLQAIKKNLNLNADKIRFLNTALRKGVKSGFFFKEKGEKLSSEQYF